MPTILINIPKDSQYSCCFFFFFYNLAPGRHLSNMLIHNRYERDVTECASLFALAIGKPETKS